MQQGGFKRILWQHGDGRHLLMKSSYGHRPLNTAMINTVKWHYQSAYLVRTVLVKLGLYGFVCPTLYATFAKRYCQSHTDQIAKINQFFIGFMSCFKGSGIFTQWSLAVKSA